MCDVRGGPSPRTPGNLPEMGTGKRAYGESQDLMRGVFEHTARHNYMSDPPEPRFLADLMVRAFGMDAGGHAFSQNVHARNISDHGARLSGLERQLIAGDVIGVQLGDKKARCKVTWVADKPVEKIDVGVQIVAGQPCPWEKQRATQRATASPPIPRTAPQVKDRRKFPRQRIPFPIEIRDGQSVGSTTLVTTADIGGGGCYIETRTPLPVGKAVTITLVEFRTSANPSRGQDQRWRSGYGHRIYRSRRSHSTKTAKAGSGPGFAIQKRPGGRLGQPLSLPPPRPVQNG